MTYRLGIDLGTTNTVASVAADRAPVQLLGLGTGSRNVSITHAAWGVDAVHGVHAMYSVRKLGTTCADCTAPATAAAHSPVPGPQAPDPTMEQTMPDHLIFDYFTSTDSEADDTIPGRPAYAAAARPLDPRAQATATIPAAGSRAAVSIPAPETPQYGAQMASSSYPPGQRPPGSPPQRPGSAPSPGQYPPGQYPPGPRGPGSPGPWSPGYSPGTPPTQPYGAGGPGGPGGYPPGPGGEGSGPFGSRGKLILIIAGVAVLVGAAVAAGVLFFRPGEPGTSTASPSVVFPPASPIPGSPTPSPSTAPSGSPSAAPSGTPTAGTANLPKSAPIPEAVIVVAFREAGETERPIYLVDSESKIDKVKLPAYEGRHANPLLPSSRDTIIYITNGTLRVMAADGSGDRKLFNQDPAGCDHVDFASWSLADPSVLAISCRISMNKRTLMLIGMNGKLIRRLDAGANVIGDLSLSPDGQTIAYWASENAEAGGGSIYTLPVIGTGAPKQLTEAGSQIDTNPAWSPDGSQIAFSRRNSWDNNYDVFVMNADGSGVRPIAETPAVDFKPTWSPDGTTMLVVSNRKSAFGGPRTRQDLWLTRVRDGEVLGSLGIEARDIARPFWALR
jgi:WD40-like Beta Propeller Repeat